MSKKLRYLTKISLNKKLKTKWFLVANIIICILFVGIINIDYIIKLFGGDFEDKININVIDNTNLVYQELDDKINNSSLYLESFNNEISLNKSNLTLEELKEDINENDIILVIDSDEDNFISAKIIALNKIDTIVYQVLSTSLNQVKVNALLNKYGITNQMLIDIELPIDIEKVVLDEDYLDDDTNDMILSVISPVVMLPLFMLIIYLVQMIGSEINEEKSTKAMEIIISNVDPKTHFTSKLLSSNLFVLIQGMLMIFYTLFGGVIRFILSSGNELASNSELVSEVTSVLAKIDIVSKLDVVIPLVLLMVVVTFVAYSLLAGILASMTTNMEDFQQLQTPITVISLLGFYLAMSSSMFDGSLFIRIMSYVPFVSSFLSLSLFTVGQIGVIDVLISIFIMVLLILWLYKYGLKIYKVGILNYSSNNLWKKIFKAMKSKE